MDSAGLPYTAFPFTLPKGLIDIGGGIHRQGIMRPVTGQDEIIAQKDPRVREHPDYFTLVILSRAIARLGTLPSVTPELLEQLFLVDLAYLRTLYHRLNPFDEEVGGPGESWATPWRNCTGR